MRPRTKKSANPRDLEAVLNRINTLTREELVEHVNWRPPASAEAPSTFIYRVEKGKLGLRNPRTQAARLRRAKRQA